MDQRRYLKKEDFGGFKRVTSANSVFTPSTKMRPGKGLTKKKKLEGGGLKKRDRREDSPLKIPEQKL